MKKLKEIMQGRNGVDELNIFLITNALIFKILAYTTHVRLFDMFSVTFLIYSLMRAFSKNIYVRRIENDKIVSVVNKIKRNYKRNLAQFKNRKEYKYIKCDNCHQKMRVPRGKGKIKVTCPKCKYQMEVRS